jgi:hypothetical protein
MSISDPQSFNRYAYVGNDPVNFIDPSGLLKAAPRITLPEEFVTVTARYDDWDDHFGADSMGDFGWLSDGNLGGEVSIIDLIDVDPPQKRTEPAQQPMAQGFPCPPKNHAKLFYNPKVTGVLSSTYELAKKTNREEGGWIYMNHRGGLMAVRKDRDKDTDPTDRQNAINLGYPPRRIGWIVVGTFHTHDYGSEPSQTVPGFARGDIDINNNDLKVPGIILGGVNSGTAAYTPYGPERGFLYNNLPERCK